MRRTADGRQAMLLLLALGLLGGVAGAQDTGSDAAAPPGADTAASAASETSAVQPTLVPWVTRQMTFHIPFTVASDGPQPLAVELYVSQDEGASWQLNARQRPDENHFQFRAQQEGFYWFAPRTVHGRQQAAKLDELRAELAVLVDLQEPKFTFEARTGPAGEVETTWEANDLSLDAGSLLVEYLPHVGQAWRPVALDKQQISTEENSLVGRMTWWPDTNASSIHVRAEVSDRAGNKAVVNRLVLLPTQPAAGANGDPAFSSQRAPVGPASPPQLTQNYATTWPLDNRLPATPLADREGAGLPRGQRANGPAATATPDVTGGSSAAARSETMQAFPPTQPAVQPPVATQFVTTRETSPAATQSVAPEEIVGRLPDGAMPRISRSRRFELDYAVDAVGPSGVQKVELWGTRDLGQTWSLWQTDEDAKSPLEIVVESDGIFGFGIVIVSNSGLAGPTPRNGDVADLWVKVDATPPEVRITSAFYGDGEHAGHLNIQWQAADFSFGEQPISLAYSDAPEGPWTTIATGMANAGLYHWKVDPRVPKKIYLRIEARDEAGNVAQYQLDEPVNLAGLTPMARIRGLRPL